MDGLLPTSLFIAFLWGIQPVIHKHVLKSIDPKTILILNSGFYSICAITFTIMYWRSVQKDYLQNKLKFKQLAWLAIAAILSGFLANLLYLFVLKKYQSYVVSTLIYSAPAFTLVMAYFVLKEKISPIGVLGVAMVVIGTICIALNLTSKPTLKKG